jgi:hypothetical protein
MKQDFIARNPGTTDTAANAMINEGGAIQQPSRTDAETALTFLNQPQGRWESLWREADSPTTVFWTAFATGLPFPFWRSGKPPGDDHSVLKNRALNAHDSILL